MSSTSNDEYFSSYDDLGVHELMLKDRPRTLAYKEFLEKNRNLLQGKVVMDVGAGTGILSMFAAKCGAKKVYAVEASAISDVCRVLVAQNELHHIVEVIGKKVEDVELTVKVDVIISEWMGFYLLHESMLNSVLFARDKFLHKDGVILPNSASLYICPVSLRDHYNETFNFWQDVYGLDFSPVLPAIKARQLAEPLIKQLSAENCISEAELVTHLDLLYIGQDELKNITGSFSFKSRVNSVMHGFACWFDVEFEGDINVVLNTGPQAPATHWKQTTVMLPHPLLICKGEEISCQLSVEQSVECPRQYAISIEMPEDDSDDEEDQADNVTAGEMLMNAMHAEPL